MVRARGVHVAIVSNSEGMLEPLFAKLGILRHFDAVLDSGKLGVEKPDPRIFEAALARFGVPASRSLHLGDTYATDVLGARAAGLRTALIDPHGHYEGRHPDVPRVAGVVEVAQAILGGRT
jgi:putative hydrolase of the HAD superfamily